MFGLVLSMATTPAIPLQLTDLHFGAIFSDVFFVCLLMLFVEHLMRVPS